MKRFFYIVISVFIAAAVKAQVPAFPELKVLEGMQPAVAGAKWRSYLI